MIPQPRPHSFAAISSAAITPTSHPSERTYPPGTNRPKAYTRPRRAKFRGILVQPDQSGSLQSEPIASSLLVVVTLRLHPRASQKDRDGPVASFLTGSFCLIKSLHNIPAPSVSITQ
ncbi:hypothetical protein PGT21_017810 [Puccinia graminis f. sp. tritici]|uniref:Uncharacterized protein n=1 Tax=Puccinia graminis f. sp. tritici TaxID=56615 RepID=A0A5B0P2P6_PUCGR|nr:hypothetical protein PGT21_017810 [Puccinia graminis f. sp. tritici]